MDVDHEILVTCTTCERLFYTDAYDAADVCRYCQESDLAQTEGSDNASL